MTRSFWQRFTRTLESEFNNAASESTFFENTFVTDYARLVHIFSEFIKRLQSNHELQQAKPTGLYVFSIILL